MDSAGSVRPCFFHRPIGIAGPGVALDAVLNGPRLLRFGVLCASPTMKPAETASAR